VFSFTLFRTKAAKKHGSFRCSALGKIRGDVIIGQPTETNNTKKDPTSPSSQSAIRAPTTLPLYLPTSI